MIICPQTFSLDFPNFLAKYSYDFYTQADSDKSSKLKWCHCVYLCSNFHGKHFFELNTFIRKKAADVTQNNNAIVD
jgi:hypothetical protein